MEQSSLAPKGRFLTTLVIFLALLAILTSLFFVFGSWNLGREIANVNEEKAALEAQLAVLREEKVEALGAAQDQKEIVEARRLEWSKIISNLQDLAPAGVSFNSYTGSDSGIIQVNGVAGDYSGLADALSVLDASEDFTYVFSPSITAGRSVDGSALISFSLELHALIK